MPYCESVSVVPERQRGVILVIMLIFMLTLNLLLLSASENAILENKMVYYQEIMLRLQWAAESRLGVIEAALQGIHLSLPPEDEEVNMQDSVNLKDVDACGRGHYLIDVIAVDKQSPLHLQALYQAAPKSPTPACKHQSMHNYQIWWQKR